MMDVVDRRVRGAGCCEEAFFPSADKAGFFTLTEECGSSSLYRWTDGTGRGGGGGGGRPKRQNRPPPRAGVGGGGGARKLANATSPSFGDMDRGRCAVPLWQLEEKQPKQQIFLLWAVSRARKPQESPGRRLTKATSREPTAPAARRAPSSCVLGKASFSQDVNPRNRHTLLKAPKNIRI